MTQSREGDKCNLARVGGCKGGAMNLKVGEGVNALEGGGGVN